MRMEQWLIIGGAACFISGCFAPEPPDIHSQNAPQLVPAIEIAVQHHDQSAVPFLVDDLSSQDAAVRIYAIDGLRRLTGKDFGYRAYDDEETRRPAVHRWQAWEATHKS
ncbi:MAG TPA: hypothetical protein VMD30_14235 [Tepidisphaeraceae bacterium]|nr:hypothetical protein [Tepidisphaeraceae bacterium]